MSRKTIEVNRFLLVQAIAQAEANGPLTNLDALWTTVADIYNKSENAPRAITKSVVMLRATAWNITLKTKPGKKGRAPGVPMSDEHKAKLHAGKRTPKAEKFAKNPEIVKGFKEMKKQTPERFVQLVQRAANGSKTAAIALHCLECSGWETSGVRLCNINSCALYAIRPYQGKKPETVEQQENAEDAA